MNTNRPVALTATLLVATATLAACATTNGNTESAAYGCYYFEQDAAAQDLGLPWGVRLLPDSLEGWPAMASYQDVRVATTLTPDGDQDHPFGYWRPLAGDSVEIGYPAGGGTTLRLHAAGDTLSGSGTPVGDAVPAGQSPDREPRPVSLTRARCPEEA